MSDADERLPAELRGPHATGLIDHLATALAANAADIVLERLSGGQSNPTFLVHCPEPRAVLRKQPPRVLSPGAHAVDREYRVLEALADSTVPVPRPISFCAAGTVLPEPFYLMAYVPGRVPADARLETFRADEREPLYLALVDTLADLHEMNWRGAGLAGLGRDHGHLSRLRRVWSGQLDGAANIRYSGLPRRVADWLERHAPADAPHVLVHGDVQLANLIVAHETPAIEAVVDWELATIGEPLTDLALLLLPYAYSPHPSPVGDLSARAVAGLGLPDPYSLLERYAARRDVDPERLPYVLVLMLLRTAGVLHGIVRRAAAGTASGGAAAARYEACIAPALDRAWAIARGGPWFDGS